MHAERQLQKAPSGIDACALCVGGHPRKDLSAGNAHRLKKGALPQGSMQGRSCHQWPAFYKHYVQISTVMLSGHPTNEEVPLLPHFGILAAVPL